MKINNIMYLYFLVLNYILKKLLFFYKDNYLLYRGELHKKIKKNKQLNKKKKKRKKKKRKIIIILIIYNNL